YTFLSVFTLWYAHKLQAQVFSSSIGAGINVLFGTACFILYKIPASVATMNVSFEDSWTYFSIFAVEPIKSANSKISSVDSGCATTSAVGFICINFKILSVANASWTMQEPSHKTISLPVVFMIYLPK